MVDYKIAQAGSNVEPRGASAGGFSEASHILSISKDTCSTESKMNFWLKLELHVDTLRPKSEDLTPG